MSRANAVYICGPDLAEHPCPRCGKHEVFNGWYSAPPECENCGWNAVDGPEEW